MNQNTATQSKSQRHPVLYGIVAVLCIASLYAVFERDSISRMLGLDSCTPYFVREYQEMHSDGDTASIAGDPIEYLQISKLRDNRLEEVAITEMDVWNGDLRALFIENGQVLYVMSQQHDHFYDAAGDQLAVVKKDKKRMSLMPNSMTNAGSSIINFTQSFSMGAHAMVNVMSRWRPSQDTEKSFWDSKDENINHLLPSFPVADTLHHFFAENSQGIGGKYLLWQNFQRKQRDAKPNVGILTVDGYKLLPPIFAEMVSMPHAATYDTENLFVAWSEKGLKSGYGPHIFVSQFDGESWKQLGSFGKDVKPTSRKRFSGRTSDVALLSSSDKELFLAQVVYDQEKNKTLLELLRWVEPENSFRKVDDVSVSKGDIATDNEFFPEPQLFEFEGKVYLSLLVESPHSGFRSKDLYFNPLDEKEIDYEKHRRFQHALKVFAVSQSSLVLVVDDFKSGLKPLRDVIHYDVGQCQKRPKS